MGTRYRLNRWALIALLDRSDFESRSAFARAAAIPPATVTQVTSGERDASVQVLRRMAAALDVPVEAISTDPFGDIAHIRVEARRRLAVVAELIDDLERAL